MKQGRRIGVTGHQDRDGLDWIWARSAIAEVLSEEGPFTQALTSLAVGTDQAFAEEAMDQAIDVKAVIPFDGYARCFEGAGLEAYEELLARCAETETLHRHGSDEEAFLAAGKRVADECNMLIAVWDGKPAVGLGGTADVVTHAMRIGRDVVHLDPFACTVRRLSA